ncbi:MAG: hypothetical protein KGI38_01045 [Thaumarchaeota archaeon]|nr:hypothetical protein [Nitrososphaerota archaeon]
MICERCHAGQMVEYVRVVGRGENTAEIKGVRCERCGYTELTDDDGIWAAVGL